VCNQHYIDSFQFLSRRLENLVLLLLQNSCNKFAHTIMYLLDSNLVFAKGIYPYSYMTGPEKFGETQLPPIEAFYSILDEEALTNEDYDRSKKTWAHYKMKTLQNYHDHYLLLDFFWWLISFKISVKPFTKNTDSEHHIFKMDVVL